jgi:hypothetical protein
MDLHRALESKRAPLVGKHNSERLYSDAPWLLKPGESVRIHNLAGRPELDHHMGKVLSYEKAKGRFAVVVPGLPNVMFFKLANLISI